MPSWQYVTIGSQNGLAPHKQYAITPLNDMMAHFIDAYL